MNAADAAVAPPLAIPSAERLRPYVKEFPDVPPSLRAKWTSLTPDQRATLRTAIDADPAAAYADVPGSEMVQMALDGYTARVYQLGRELESQLDRTRTAKNLTAGEKATDEVMLTQRITAQVADLRVARDQILAAHEASAIELPAAFERSLWDVSSAAEGLARERWKDARGQGVAAVRALLEGVGAGRDEEAKRALLRLARADARSALERAEKGEGAGDFATMKRGNEFGAVVREFEEALTPSVVRHAAATLAAISQARTDIGMIDSLGFRRAQQGR